MQDVDGASLADAVIECSWLPDRQRWFYMRVRHDKQTPNAYHVYEKVRALHGVGLTLGLGQAPPASASASAEGCEGGRGERGAGRLRRKALHGMARDAKPLRRVQEWRARREGRRQSHCVRCAAMLPLPPPSPQVLVSIHDNIREQELLGYLDQVFWNVPVSLNPKP